MTTPLKRRRAAYWREAREAQETQYRQWLDANAAELAKLSRAVRSEVKRAKWESMKPPEPSKARMPRSARQEARRVEWYAARAEVMASIVGRLSGTKAPSLSAVVNRKPKRER